MAQYLLKFNPGLLSDEDILKLFVARREELVMVLQRIRENTDASVNQHLLFVGPRGCGKTTLVRAVAAEVRATPELSAYWYPLALSEETYAVSTLGELWLEALFHLARQTGSQRYRQAHQQIRGERDESRLRVLALGQIVDFAEEQGKRILLFVENLQMLFEDGLDKDEAWAFRETLIHEPHVMVLATATTRFQEIENVDEAMYEQFLVTDLRPLRDDQCREFWSAVTGKKIPRSRIRPIQILTGGNLRLLAIIAQFAVHSSFGELMQDLVRLVDDHTDYFKNHIDALPAQERKVYVTLAEIWDPAGARQVAEHARLDVSKTSAHLNRLVQRGAVLAQGGKSKTYQVAERLYNIYYLLRHRGDSSSRVRALVQFMVSFYEPRDLEQHAQRVAAEMAALNVDACSDHQAFLDQLCPFLSQAMRDSIAGIHVEGAERASMEQAGPISGHESEDVIKELVTSLLAEGRFSEAEALARRATDLRPDNVAGWATLSRCLVEGEHFSEAEHAIRKGIDLKPDNAAGWAALATFLIWRRHFSEAEEPARKAAELKPDNAGGWASLAASLMGQQRYSEAEEPARKALALKPEDRDGWINLAGCLIQQQRYSEAEETARKATELKPDNAAGWAYLSASLMGQERYSEAEEPARMAAHLEPDTPIGWAILTGALVGQARISEAEAPLRRATQLKPHNPHELLVQAALLRWRRDGPGLAALADCMVLPDEPDDRSLAAVASVLTMIAGAGQVSAVLDLLRSSPLAPRLEPLVCALRMINGEDPIMAQEIMEVARDVKARIEEIGEELASGGGAG